MNCFRLVAASTCLLLGACATQPPQPAPAEAPITSVEASAATASGYLQHPQARQFLQTLDTTLPLARAHIETLLSSATRQEKILEAIARPAEKTKTWAEYRPIFLTEKRISAGVEFYQRHRDAFEQAQRTFGVPAEIILAIIGVETYYGRYMGSYRVIDALATLAFDYPPRSPFFTDELRQFLYLEAEAGLDLNSVKGSYAGAMGLGQFISSSYRRYAVDFDGDGRRDLIANPVDAIGSVANYFVAHGWQPGASIAVRARDVRAADMDNPLKALTNQSLQPSSTIMELRTAGLVPEQPLADTMRVSAWALEGAEGLEYWIGLHNFFVITRYNHSHLYAMAVFQLSEALRERL